DAGQRRGRKDRQLLPRAWPHLPAARHAGRPQRDPPGAAHDHHGRRGRPGHVDPARRHCHGLADPPARVAGSRVAGRDRTMLSVSEAAPAASSAPKRDRFGNLLDPKVGYARGRIITGEVAEAQRQQRAHAIIRERFARSGDAGVFNLTGLIRAFPYEAGDSEAMRSYVHFIARSQGELEQMALTRMGGDPARHDGFLSTRVTAGMLATMLALLKPGDRVLSLVAADRSHPSVKQAVEL